MSFLLTQPACREPGYKQQQGANTPHHAQHRNTTSASKNQQRGAKPTQGKDNGKAGSSRGFGCHLKPDSAKMSSLGYELHYWSSGGSRGLCFLHQAPHQPGGVSPRHEYLLQDGGFCFPQGLFQEGEEEVKLSR